MSDENAWWKLLIGHFSGRDCLVNCEIDIMAGLVLFGREVEELYYREADSGIISSPARRGLGSGLVTTYLLTT